MKWFRFYHDAIDDPKVQRLPGDTFKFWINMLCLASQSNERGLINLSAEEIAFATRLDDEEAEAMLSQLIKRNLLEETTEGFQIHNWDKRQFKSDNVTERVSKYRDNKKIDSGNDDETLQETLSDEDETLHPSVITDTDTDTDTDSRRKRSTTLENRFDEFWSHYPRKEAKGAARKAWSRIKPDDELTARMIEAVKAQSQSPKWKESGGQFIPHPATWLNSERWEDESGPGSLSVVGASSIPDWVSLEPGEKVIDLGNGAWDISNPNAGYTKKIRPAWGDVVFDSRIHSSIQGQTEFGRLVQERLGSQRRAS